jgi:hypothetical protein
VSVTVVGVRGQVVVSAGGEWDELVLVAPGHGDGNSDRGAALEAAPAGVRKVDVERRGGVVGRDEVLRFLFGEVERLGDGAAQQPRSARLASQRPTGERAG